MTKSDAEINHDIKPAGLSSQHKHLLESFRYQGNKTSLHQAPVRHRASKEIELSKKCAPTRTNADVSQVKKRKKSKARPYASPSVYQHLNTVPDHLNDHLKILTCGINPGLTSSKLGQHYGFRGNHFWKCLFLSGLIDEPLTSVDGPDLPDKYDIGLTNLVDRPTAEMSELGKQELIENSYMFLRKVGKYKPKIVIFVGLGIAKAVLTYLEKHDLISKPLKDKHERGDTQTLGLQPYRMVVDGKPIYFWAVASTSPRVAAYSLDDKVQQWIEAKEFLDGLPTTSPPVLQDIDYDSLQD